MSNTMVSGDFYRHLKDFFEELSNDPDHGDKFARIDKSGKIKAGKKKGDGSELYFINIDKLRRLTINDVKFLIDNMCYLAQEKLSSDEKLENINFCSLSFKKVKPTKRGEKMLKMRNISSKPSSKMKISIKNKEFIKL